MKLCVESTGTTKKFTNRNGTLSIGLSRSDLLMNRRIDVKSIRRITVPR